jgi:ankyrin repeat protein
MKLEVLQYGQNPNEVDAEGKTPLMHAVWMNRQAVIELLLLPEAGLGQVRVSPSFSGC